MPVSPLIQKYEVIGLGFGPSNLAIAGAFLENQLGSPISIDRLLFIERHSEFKWHPAMLLPGTRMQVNFLKDLATLRSPQSPLTFISYLHSQGRLLDFINRGSTSPTRKEYSDYLSWAAQYVQDQGVEVAFGEEVVALGEVDTSTIQVYSRVLSSGQQVVRLTKNLIISPGGSPRIPRPLAMTWVQERMIHSSTYLTSVIPLLNLLRSHKPAGSPLRMAVIGSGQSAAEIVVDLHSRLATIPVIGEKAHALDLLIHGGSLRPSDDSPFVNEVFNPETTERIFRLPSSSLRQEICLEYANTNYGVINRHTLDLLYDMMDDQRLDEAIARRTNRIIPTTKPRFTIMNHSEIVSAKAPRTSQPGISETELGPLILVLRQTVTCNTRENSYDAIFCATGYERQSWLRLLTDSSLGKYFGLDASAQHHTRLEVEAGLLEDGVDKHGYLPSVGDGNDQNRPPNAPLNSGGDMPATMDGIRYRPHEKGGPTKKLYISRAYRLLPTIDHGQGKLQAGIYVQGLAEETHGLSDTLLSVVGIRAGEIVDDLCTHFVSEVRGDKPTARM